MARNDRRVSTDVFWISAFAGMTCPPVDTDHSMACLALPVFLRVVQRGVQRAEGPPRCFLFSQDWGIKGVDSAESSGAGVPTPGCVSLPLQPQTVTGIYAKSSTKEKGAFCSPLPELG